MATEKILIEIQTQLKETTEELTKVKGDLQAIRESQKDIQDNSKDAAKGIKGMASAFRGVGTAIKAMGIGLVLKAFDLFSEILMENQIAVDAFSKAFEFASIVVSDFINWISENAGAIGETITAIFENPMESLKKFGNAIKDNIIERFQSALDMMGYLGEAMAKLFTGDFDGAIDAVKNAGKELVDVATGVEDSFDKIVETGGELIDTIVDYTTETYKAAEAQTDLNKAAELAEIRNQGLIEQYDRQAEQLRQIRDDETKTFEERIKANEDLGVLLDEQEKAMLKNAQLRLDQANAKLALDKNNHEAQKEYLQAINELAAIEAQITGFRSEQMSNEISLQREQTDAINETKEARKEASADYFADLKDRIEKKKEAVDAEKALEAEKAAAIQEAEIAAADATFQALGALAKEGSDTAKGIAVAETIWNTAKAIMGMLAAQPAGVWNWVQAAAVATMGAVQIANILKTDPENADSGSIASVPSAPSVNTTVNALESSPSAQIAGLGNSQPQRAFVVSSDITTQQGLDRRILSNATFG